MLKICLTGIVVTALTGCGSSTRKNDAPSGEPAPETNATEHENTPTPVSEQESPASSSEETAEANANEPNQELPSPNESAYTDPETSPLALEDVLTTLGGTWRYCGIEEGGIPFGLTLHFDTVNMTLVETWSFDYADASCSGILSTSNGSEKETVWQHEIVVRLTDQAGILAIDQIWKESPDQATYTSLTLKNGQLFMAFPGFDGNHNGLRPEKRALNINYERAFEKLDPSEIPLN